MKPKEKAINPKRPNPYFHMLFWGTGGGWILALLYIMFFWEAIWIGHEGVAVLAKQPLNLLLNPMLWFAAMMIGAIPGAILGLLEGFMLGALMRAVPIAFSQKDMQAIQVNVYSWTGLTTLLAALFLTWLVFGFDLRIYAYTLLPSIIAGIASAYAAHRYLFRLRLWSEAVYGIQKEKAKNIEHLEDKAKTDILELEDEEESSISGLS